MKTLFSLALSATIIGSCNSHPEKQPALPLPAALPAGVEIKDSMISFNAVHLNDAIKVIIQQYHYKGLTSTSIKSVPSSTVNGGFNLRQPGRLTLKAIGHAFDLDIRVINDSVDIQPIKPERI